MERINPLAKLIAYVVVAMMHRRLAVPNRSRFSRRGGGTASICFVIVSFTSYQRRRRRRVVTDVNLRQGRANRG